MDQNNFGHPAAFDWNRAKLTHRGFLPHVRQDNAIYFVTFRLGDSLPISVSDSLNRSRDEWLKHNPLPHSPDQIKKYREIWTAPIENWLDNGLGSCVFKDEKTRNILENVLRFNDGVKYRLGEFVIMPNHVHLLISMAEGCELSETVRVWKSYSSRLINRASGRQGNLWMREYFDHAVRADEYLKRFIVYIRQNPDKLRPGEFTLGKGSLKV